MTDTITGSNKLIMYTSVERRLFPKKKLLCGICTLQAVDQPGSHTNSSIAPIYKETSLLSSNEFAKISQIYSIDLGIEKCHLRLVIAKAVDNVYLTAVVHTKSIHSTLYIFRFG